jgi:hypothetical protein
MLDEPPLIVRMQGHAEVMGQDREEGRASSR